MAVEEELQKIISFTSKFTSGPNFGSMTSFKIPGSNITEMLLGDDGDDLEISSLSDVKNIISDVGGTIMTGANIINCAFTMHSVDGWSNFLGSLAMGVTGVIASIADEIWNAIAVQLNMAVQQIINTLFNIVTAIHNLIKSGLLIVQAIKNLFSGDGFSDLWKKLSWPDFIAKENCADMFAAIAGCFLNKFLGPYIDEFKEKATSKINELGKSMNDLIYDELADANLYAAYANREAFLLEKMSIQINGYNNLLSSGNSSTQATSQPAAQQAGQAAANQDASVVQIKDMSGNASKSWGSGDYTQFIQ